MALRCIEMLKKDDRVRAWGGFCWFVVVDRSVSSHFMQSCGMYDGKCKSIQSLWCTDFRNGCRLGSPVIAYA